jgi:methionyl-tRNA synthetase
VDLRVARIEKVERHPKADKLYIESINLGDEKRQIVSGLVPYYREEDLAGRNIVLVYNLKTAKLRGVMSQGMLLAAEVGDTVEVIFVDHAQPGERVILEAEDEKDLPAPGEISIDEFFTIPIEVKNFTLKVEGRSLLAGGSPIEVQEVENGQVG